MRTFPPAPAARRPGTSQRGAVLIVALLMLILLTLFALNTIRTSNVGLRVVGNQQIQRVMEASAQDAIEQVMSNASSFGPTATAQTISVNGFSVAVVAPACIYTTVASGFSATIAAAAITPEDDTFEVVATVSDPVTGAQATVHQGVRMRAVPGTCP